MLFIRKKNEGPATTSYVDKTDVLRNQGVVRAGRQLAEGNLPEAEKQARSALRCFPGLEGDCWRAGNAAWRRHDMTVAAHMFFICAVNAPDNAVYKDCLSQCLHALDKDIAPYCQVGVDVHERRSLQSYSSEATGRFLSAAVATVTLVLPTANIVRWASRGQGLVNGLILVESMASGKLPPAHAASGAALVCHRADVAAALAGKVAAAALVLRTSASLLAFALPPAEDVAAHAATLSFVGNAAVVTCKWLAWSAYISS